MPIEPNVITLCFVSRYRHGRREEVRHGPIITAKEHIFARRHPRLALVKRVKAVQLNQAVQLESSFAEKREIDPEKALIGLQYSRASRYDFAICRGSAQCALIPLATTLTRLS